MNSSEKIDFISEWIADYAKKSNFSSKNDANTRNL